jgi:hypothetical protein
MRTRKLFFPLTIAHIALAASSAHSQLEDCTKLVVSYQDRDSVHNPVYSLDLRAPNGGRLVYLGAEHTFDIHSPQFESFERAWSDLRPTFAFYEGTDTSVGISREEAITKLGEPGFVRFLARRDGVPVVSLEPRRQDEVDFLLKRFSPEHVKLFYVLRVVAELRDRRGRSPEDLQKEMGRVLDHFSRYRGLESVVRDTDELNSAYAHFWKNPAHWWEAPADWFNPLVPSSATGGIFTNEVNQASSTFRDIHMFEVLATAARRGERVFAVVGRDHIPMQEAALKCALK